MQIELITKEEAAQVLGVTPTTIGRYWREGKLSFRIVNRKRRCVYEEVLALLEHKDINVSNLKYEFIALKYKVGVLAKEVEILRRKLGVERKTVFKDDDLINLYQGAQKPPAKVTAHDASSWAAALNALDEADYARLKNLVKDPYPWAVFLTLLDKLLLGIKRKRAFNSSVSLQQASIDLQVAIDKVRKLGRMVFQQGNKASNDSAFISTLPSSDSPIEPKSLP